MNLRNTLSVFAALCLALGGAGLPSALAQTPPAPDILSLSRPAGGEMQLIFRGKTGPFRVQSRATLEAGAAWFDVATAKVTEIEAGVYLALIPMGRDDIGYYRIVNENETIAELKGWTALVQVSAPANGSYFVAGEAPVITVTILDTFAAGITRDSLSALALYMHGPQDPTKTVTPLKLLNVTGDRTKSVHHYVNLKTSADAVVKDNVITYNLKPITDEAPGTYTISLRATLAADTVQQFMKFADIQIGTADKEVLVTSDASCAACHKGTESGKMYMHHIDPTTRGVNWAYDYQPEKSCKACHNNDGYAAFTWNGVRVPDHIAIRVHGVHMGEHLSSDRSTNATGGIFVDYIHQLFPADARNCTACHVNDNWKTKPSTLACGTCHDNTWFGTEDTMPAGMVMHEGDAATDDECAGCHSAKRITTYHTIVPAVSSNSVTMSISAPANGKFFVAGETPSLSIQVLKGATVLDPKTIVEPAVSTNVQPNEWRGANLYVYGPRSEAVPVLTTSAAIKDPTKSTLSNDLRVRLKPANEDTNVTRTADTILYKLADVAGLAPGTYTAYMEARPAVGTSATKLINFQIGQTNVERMLAGNCASCHADTRIHSTSRNLAMQVEACKACHDNQHQMTGKTNWTNSQYGYGVSPIGRRVHGIHNGRYLAKPNENGNFGETIFPQDVRNCTKCHNDSTSWSEKPSRLACLACHDSDLAKMHGTLNTYDPTPADPWSSDEFETCELCHGPDADFSIKKVHSIANPFVAPYPREPAE